AAAVGPRSNDRLILLCGGLAGIVPDAGEAPAPQFSEGTSDHGPTRRNRTSQGSPPASHQVSVLDLGEYRGRVRGGRLRYGIRTVHRQRFDRGQAVHKRL